MHDAAIKPRLELDAAGHLAGDIPCVSCGYNLRGLQPEGTCPECGTSVTQSASGHLLRFADPRWLNRVAIGMETAVATLVLALFCFVALVVAGFNSTIGAMLIALGAVFLPVTTGWVACVLFTTPDPRDTSLEKLNSPRHVARWSASILVGLMALSIATEMAIGTTYVTPAFMMLGVLDAIIGVEAAGRYASLLALRAPKPELARQTRVVGRGCAIVGASVLFGMMSAAAFEVLFNNRLQIMDSSLLQVIGCVYALGAFATFIAFIVLGIWTLVLIVRYTKLLRETADLARLGNSRETA